MEILIKACLWLVISTIAGIIMRYGTTMLVGPLDFNHWIPTLILVIVNVKIYFIISDTITIKDITDE